MWEVSTLVSQNSAGDPAHMCATQPPRSAEKRNDTRLVAVSGRCWCDCDAADARDTVLYLYSKRTDANPLNVRSHNCDVSMMRALTGPNGQVRRVDCVGPCSCHASFLTSCSRPLPASG